MHTSRRAADFRRGVLDILPVLAAAAPIGLLWGTLAAARGLSPFEAWLTSATVFAGAAQFVAVDMWRDPLPLLLIVVTTLIVNVRHLLMGASLQRHLGDFSGPGRLLAMLMMTDESWAFAERKVLAEPLRPAYYFGVAGPMWLVWTAASLAGAVAGRTLGDPAVYGFDFAFSAMFIAILAGFWKGPRTAAVLATSAVSAALAKLAVPGAWYIIIGGVAGVIVAALLDNDVDADDADQRGESAAP
ncbi:MAG: AzlC family ABC transporter permease [Candidatus Accumulibacter sp.]|uniref:AzlC family ABC transporter permease n=1 Tax=Accumulibacter sp. TaxID=2053492 RepID=UPI0019FA6D3A|nr:AzlC family ABC transporter permease [Accumulibacter sp.]MBE2258276.1 AzlC family ABC transporter permease [Paracoccaceae bacterium]MCB1942760.1 AzlC family ABC transporter permease [Accumulibacter sp.]MCP5247115.1 AzlC family ABC transporter permease [Accumulibacter sp.]